MQENISGAEVSLNKSSSESRSNIRPIHYLGSKLRLLEQIKQVIDEIDPTRSPVCDLFSGSGTVSKFLAKERKVVSVDIQEYSRVLCSALLNPSSGIMTSNEYLDACFNSNQSKILKECFNEIIEYEEYAIKVGIDGDLEPICDLLENGSIITAEKQGIEESSNELSSIMYRVINNIRNLSEVKESSILTVRYFGGLYFSYRQALELDLLLEQAFKLDTRHRDTYIAAVLSTASEIVNTVGKQFAQPLKPRSANGVPKKNIINKIKKDRSLSVNSIFKEWLDAYTSIELSEHNHEVLRGDYADALNKLDSSVKVVYADPPYTRYHYSRYYHVLETMSLRDNPELSLNNVNGKQKISRGIYREERHQSPFSIKSKSNEAFRIMFERVSSIGASLVLSYSPFDTKDKNAPRVMTVEALVSLAENYFMKVDVISVGEFSHSKLNKIETNSEKTIDSELLIVCKNTGKENNEC